VSDVYDTTTIGSLVAEEARMRAGEALSYSI
jgi:hypothetical protein